VAIQRGFVIVSGAPGAGKSTLAPPLAESLGLPLFGKDRLKETLHDHIPGHGDPRAWSRALGGAAMELMWSLAATTPAAVLEANFRPHSPYERRRISELGEPLVEVHCRCPQAVAAARYAARHAAGLRHPTHVVSELSPDLLGEFDQPIALSPVIEVDTTTDVDFARLAGEVTWLLTGGRL
jgi:predicted kinase